jgi:hypothetical protein
MYNIKTLFYLWFINLITLLYLAPVQAGLILRDFFLCDLALMRHENLHHFSNLRNNFWYNAIWHRRSMATRFFCRRLAESDITVPPSVTCMDWLRWWCNHMAHSVLSSNTLAFLSTMNEKCKSTSSSAIHVKNQWKIFSIEEELHLISWLEKSEQIVHVCCNVRLAHSVVHIQIMIMLVCQN